MANKPANSGSVLSNNWYHNSACPRVLVKIKVVVLDSVTDVKDWMSNQIPLLHDHLKAHQFKFQRNESGECVMFYKEWSTDPIWLPQSGLSFLPNGNTIPNKLPLIVTPYYDPENLKLLKNTLKKISGYLNKASISASAWWTKWLEHAHQLNQRTKPQPIKGECT